MKRHYTDKEIKEKLKDLTIIIDTQEKVNGHITEFFDKKKIPQVQRSLDIADYSAMIGNMTWEHDVVVERKANIDEIAGNFTAQRARFEREFLRAKANGCKVFLVIENCSWSDIFLHNYQSKLLPKSLVASLLSWQIRFNITIIFCKQSETAQIIYGILYYTVRESLKNGN